MYILELLLLALWLVYWVVVRLLLLIVILNTVPLLVMAFLFVSSMYLHLYQMWNQIQADYSDAKLFTTAIYEQARENVCTAWDIIGKIWFGYEIHGLENLPKDGGAILAYYHGTIPIDIYMIISKVRLENKRALHTVADKFVFKLHGLKLLWRVFGVITGTREECITCLKEGNMIAIAPGGTREAYFSENYNLMWAQRKGFAQVAREAKVPIIPLFTKNGREAFRTPRFGRSVLRWLYEKTRGPVVPIYGGFPVKLETYIGKPIPYDEAMSVEDLVQKTHDSLENLISAHQTRPGSLRRALLERVKSKPKVQ